MLVKWNIGEKDGRLLARIPEQIFSVAYDNKTGRCALGTRVGSIYEIDVNTNVLLAQWQAHPESIFELSYQNKQLISAGGDGNLRVWNTERHLEWEIPLSDKSLRSIWRHKEQLFVSGSAGKAWSIDASTWETGTVWEMSKNSVFVMCGSKEFLYSAGRDAHIHIWKDQKRIQELEAHWYSIHALALSPDEKYLVSGSMDKSIKLWNAENGQLLKVIDRERLAAHTSSVNSIIWMDENTFVSCSDDRTVMAFRISNLYP